MGTIDVESAPFDRYESLIEADARQETLSAAQSLKGLRVVHVNATPTGGGVAEILRSLVPMMRGLGIDASWWALEADEGFFTITKRLHNGLQGKVTSLCRQDIECYWLHNERAASAIEMAFGSADILVAHDPQVMAIPAFLPAVTAISCRMSCCSPRLAARRLVSERQATPDESCESPRPGLPRPLQKWQAC